MHSQNIKDDSSRKYNNGVYLFYKIEIKIGNRLKRDNTIIYKSRR